MKFNSNCIFFSLLSDQIDITMNANKNGPIKSYTIYRLVLKTDAYLKFIDDPTLTIPADGTEGALLKANQEYFVNSGSHRFIGFSRAIVTADDNVIEVQ